MRTSTRLILTFSSILVLFAIASFVTVRAMDRMARADEAVAASDRAKHAGHRVAALVREQYIHQAHTIIEGNRSHLDHYKDIAARTRTASDELVSMTRTERQRDLANEVAVLVRRNDDEFLASTLPAIERGDRAEVLRLHMDMEMIVGRATKLVGELNDRFEEDSTAASAGADAVRARARLTAIVCFVAAAVFAACASAFTTRSLARRVALLRDGTRRIGDGDLSQRIALEGNDELADLGRSVDDMAAKLADHQRELVRSQKLAAIGRLSASVAHEINGPLGIILGYAKIIRKEGLDDEALNAIEDEARQAHTIVQGLLELSRNDGLVLGDVDLGRLACEVIERLRATSKLKARTVSVPRAPSGAIARADEIKLRQVILSLIDNAVEATTEGGTITIEAELHGDRAVLAVADDGPGFDAEAKAHLFEPFFTTKRHGTGLGLALAHAAVEAHHGEIRVESGARGTRLEIHLPRGNP